MHDVVLAYQDQMRVEHYGQNADSWELTAHSKPGAVSLTQIYADIGLESP